MLPKLPGVHPPAQEILKGLLQFAVLTSLPSYWFVKQQQVCCESKALELSLALPYNLVTSLSPQPCIPSWAEHLAMCRDVTSHEDSAFVNFRTVIW